MNRWAGPLIAILIVGGVAAILVSNIEPRRTPGVAIDANLTTTAQAPPAPGPAKSVNTGAFREYPIGEEHPEVLRHLRVAAVWLPSVEWDGQKAVAGTDVIHLEADVKATENNPNGFAKNEFIPYLKIAYKIEPAGGGPALAGDLLPMVAADGLHYGASVRMTKAGKYRLTYAVEPPSAGGLGRHSDPITGVAAWWTPFVAAYDWDYEPPAPPVAARR